MRWWIKMLAALILLVVLAWLGWSLMSGMLVTFRTPLETTSIKLKFQQTYKFALMAEASGELLMEQADVAAVESIMQSQRK